MNKARLLRIILIPLALLLALAAVGGVLVMTALRPLILEAGEPLPADGDFCRYPFLAAAVERTGGAPDSALPGKYPLAFTVLGFARRTVLTVEDTIPPAALPQTRTCFLGDSLEITDFYTGLADATAVEAHYITPPDFAKAGEQTIVIGFTDMGGNLTELPVQLTVHAISHNLTVEAGTPVEEIQATIRASLEGDEINFISGFGEGELDTAVLGEHFVYLTLDGEEVKLSLTVVDTTPPSAAPRLLPLLLGQRADPIDFLRSLTDVTPVTVAFAEEPDFSKLGAQPVSLILTDGEGNSLALTAALRVYPVPAAFTAELGTDPGELSALLLAGTTLSFADDSLLTDQLLGEHELIYLTPSGVRLTQRLTFVDTTPPVGEAQNRTAYLGDVLKPDDFFRYVADASPVTVAYTDEKAPDFTQLGIQTVSLTLTDAVGNRTSFFASLTILRDTEPPVIYGANDMTVYLGETVSYLRGVSAWDNADGSVKVSVAASGVKLKTPGSYSVTYTAVDRAGNAASKTVTLTVSAIDTAAVNAMADAVLSSILYDSMTDYQRARAIYDWTVANLSYTAYADKSDYVTAAYYGFRNKRGDCFVYYAVSRLLLTRAGFENLEIHRNIPEKPHFWNLVNYNGAWYHYDTCPHYAGHPLTCFLLTDREVKAYSDNHVADYYSFDASLYPATP